MIGFNTLLRDEGIDPAQVRLARHQDTRWEGRPTPYKLWTAQKSDLELYQQIQRRPVFRDAKLLASFVATPFDETLFIGLYPIGDLMIAEPGLIDPLTNEDAGGRNFYEMHPATELANYAGRLVVNWGLGYCSWVQLTINQDKPEARPPSSPHLHWVARIRRASCCNSSLLAATHLLRICDVHISERHSVSIVQSAVYFTFFNHIAFTRYRKISATFPFEAKTITIGREDDGGTMESVLQLHG